MFLLWSGIVAAVAACPDVDGLVDEARSAFADAEVEQSRAALARAYEALSCQQATVPRESLLALYHLDALASIADEDSKASLFAVIRAVSVDPDAPPPSDFGPELASQHETWAGRLREDRVRVSVNDREYTVWVDGLALGSEPVDLVTGEHVVQARGPEGWTSRVMDLSVGGKDRGLPLDLLAVPEPLAPPVQTDPISPPMAPQPGRKVRGGVVATGVVMALAGGGAILGGRVLESRFEGDPYSDPTYGDCARADACWLDARSDRIAADARTANAAYLTGYGLTGLGVGLVGLEVLVLRTAGRGSGVSVRGRF